MVDRSFSCGAVVDAPGELRKEKPSGIVDRSLSCGAVEVITSRFGLRLRLRAPERPPRDNWCLGSDPKPVDFTKEFVSLLCAAFEMGDDGSDLLADLDKEFTSLLCRSLATGVAGSLPAEELARTRTFLEKGSTFGVSLECCGVCCVQ